MNAYDTYRVCGKCFDETRSRNNPILEKSKHQGFCKTCGRDWVGINVGYYYADHKYYEIRPRPFYGENKLCNYIKNTCYQGLRCRYAHNKFELELWIQEEKMLRNKKRPGASKISCVICGIEFKDIPNLETHMESIQHVARTEGMKLLPEVGSSLQYSGPIRARPKVPFKKDTYELCRNFTRHGRCDFANGCKHAHSEEELKVWQQAQRVEEETRRRSRETRGQSHSSSRSSASSNSSKYSSSSSFQSGAWWYPSFSSKKKPADKRKAELHSRKSQTMEDYGYVKRQYGEIDFIGIEHVISNIPDYIEILCDNYLIQILEESEKDFKWTFRIKASKPEILHGVLLYEHRNMFRLGGAYKGIEGGKWGEMKYPYVPNRSCYQLYQEMDVDTYMDVSVLFRPRIGQHEVSIVFEWMDGELVARKIKVKVTGVEYREASKDFKAKTLPTYMSNNTSQPNSGSNNTSQPNSGSNNTSQPNSGSNNTSQPSSGSNNTSQPNSGSNNTSQPNSGSNNTSQPNSGSNNTSQPNSGSNNTSQPSSGSNNTSQPSSRSNNTSQPNSGSNNTSQPSSGSNNTSQPSSRSNYTSQPSSGSNCTSQPSSGSNNTSQPSSGSNNTSQPSSESNYTSQPSSRSNNTSQPSSRSNYTSQPSSRSNYTSQPSSGSNYTSQPNSGNNNTSQPSSRSNNTSQPSSRSNNTSQPSSGSNNTSQPSSESNYTSQPSSRSNNTSQPSSRSNNTSQPSSGSNNTSQPSSGSNYTSQPSSGSNCTSQPSSRSNNTSQPSSGSNNTSQPSSRSNNTSQPSSESNYTSQPSSGSNCTSQPSSRSNNTSQPSSGSNNTSQPSSRSNNTSQPSSGSNNTSQPSSRSNNTSQPSSRSNYTSQTKFYRSSYASQPNIISIQETPQVNWEQKHHLVNAKDYLNKHKMPDNMEERIKTGFFDKINDQIVKSKYKIRFQTLLYLEEFEHKRSLLKYDLVDVRISFDTVSMETIRENDSGRERVETAQPNNRFIRFDLNNQLFEGYRAFRPPKIAYIIPNYTKNAHECNCVRTGIDYLTFSITIDTIKACEKSGGLAMVRFMPERDEYEKMHQALDDMEKLKEAILFPALRQVRTPDNWDEDHLLSLLTYETLSTTQKEAVYSIINRKYTSFPTIICGPFGCGKTQTLSIAAKLIAMNFRGSRILIAAKTNSCANIYVESLGHFFDTIEPLKNKRGRPILFRHFAITRNINSDRNVSYFANIQDETYQRLSLNELEKCSIIITTTVACSSLVLRKDRSKANNLFTHILIDEAAQLIEPEACIPLSLAGPATKVALAGDVRQSHPLILSKQGRRFNLDQSLLERLETLPEYQSESSFQCKISLKDNYRSSVEIVQFLSELFYENCLRANPPALEGPVSFPSLSFLHVKGEEERLYGFPSFYNKEEADVTVRALKKFARLGVRAENMAVLTTYKSQVRLIYEYLTVEERKCRNLGHFRDNREFCKENNCVNKRTIDIKNLEGIQGREYDLIIVNTVRTIMDIPNDISLEEKLDLGLLDDVKQFNTILTRARGWVMVIGDADSVTNVGECSNVWSKYVDACEGYKGFFKYVEEFETFEVKRGREERENRKAKPTKISSKTNRAVGSSEGVALHEDVNDEMYQTKFNSLHTVITACQQELTLAQTDDAVSTAISEQLTFTKIALENLERQRYLEQQRTHPSVRTHNRDATTSSSVRSCEAVFLPGNVNGDLYETKLNSLHTVLTTCQQELTLAHTNAEIARAVSEQLTFVRIVLENLEKQRYKEQEILKGMHPSVHCQNPANITIVPSCEQASAQQLASLSTDIIQPPMRIVQSQSKPQTPQHSYCDSFQPE